MPHRSLMFSHEELNDAYDGLVGRAEKAEALAAEMRGELDKLTQELYDSKHLAARRLKSLDAWKAKEKEFRHQFFIEECAHDHTAQFTKEYHDLAASRLELLRECEWVKFGPTVICPVCKSTMNVFGGGHADDCKLAEELGDD